jgi:hypothetical protein
MHFRTVPNVTAVVNEIRYNVSSRAHIRTQAHIHAYITISDAVHFLTYTEYVHWNVLTIVDKYDM